MRSMLADLRTVILPAQRWKVALLALLVVVAGFVEFVAVLMLPAFVYALSHPAGEFDIGPLASLRAWAGDGTEQIVLPLFGIAIIAVFLLRTVMLLGTGWYRTRLVSAMVRDLSMRLYSGYLRAPYHHFLLRNSTEFVDAILYDARKSIWGVIPPLMALLLNVSLIVVLVPTLFAIDPVLAVFLAAAGALACYAFVRANRARLSRNVARAAASRLALQIAIREGIGAIRHLRLRGLEAEAEAEVRGHAHSLAHAETHTEFILEVPRPLFELLAGSGLIVVALLLLPRYPPGLILPMLALGGAITIRMVPMLNALTGHLGALRANVLPLATVARELRLLEAERPPDRPATSEPVHGDIAFRNVTYRYPGQEANVLKGVDFTIAEGESVAFVGPTGSGKSTILDMMLGFLAPTSGEVTVGERPIAEVACGWQATLGYVPQVIYLLDASILRNVALGVPGKRVDEAGVWAALKQAQLAGFVAELPAGLHTQIGERGVRLSGGQRQRIGIARALHHHPRVLVLDEATAALDNATERKLMAALRESSQLRTTIMVAHRLSSVRHCDRIMLVKDGRIANAGTYDELVATDPDFRDLASSPAT